MRRVCDNESHWTDNYKDNAKQFYRLRLPIRHFNRF